MTIEGFSQWVRNPQNGSNAPPLNAVLFVGNDPNLPDTGMGIVIQKIQAATVDGGTGASAEWGPGISGAGGALTLAGGDGASAAAGGSVFLQGGVGDAGTGTAAALFVQGSDASGVNGRAGITTDGSTGTLGQVPIAQGDDTFLWGPAGSAVFHGATIYLAADQPGNAYGSTVVPAFDTIAGTDPDGYVTGGGVLTIPTGLGGIYIVTANVQTTPLTTLALNGTAYIGTSASAPYDTIALSAVGPIPGVPFSGAVVNPIVRGDTPYFEFSMTSPPVALADGIGIAVYLSIQEVGTPTANTYAINGGSLSSSLGLHRIG